MLGRRFLLFPGRHLCLTRFHEEHVASLLKTPLRELAWRDMPPEDFLESSSSPGLDHVVFAITSCNQPATCRFNPLPFHVRAIGCDRFGRDLRGVLNAGSNPKWGHDGGEARLRFSILGIPHYHPHNRFSNFVTQEIFEETGGTLSLSPDNTAILCGTESVLDLYARDGFGTLPCELGQNVAYPQDVVAKIASVGSKEWQKNEEIVDLLSTTSISTFDDFPETVSTLVSIYREPLITNSGSLTEDRNYESYALGMSNPHIISEKMKEIRPFLPDTRSGRIVDEGCADGALLRLISREAPDACLLGVDLSSEFLAMCAERQRRGDFGQSFVHFHQRNLLNQIFEDASIDTTICNSTLHEIWSYGSQEVSLRNYLRLKLQQTREGGRLIIRDVVGPENGDMPVWLWLRCDDGSNENIFEHASYGHNAGNQSDLENHLNQLSTASRFVRFAADFKVGTGGRRNIEYSCDDDGIEPSPEGGMISECAPSDAKWKRFCMSLRDCAEFMSKFDYTDNWTSELHEEFCFWSFKEWEKELSDAGWTVLEGRAPTGSHAYTSQWQVDKRFEGRMIITDQNNTLLPWPHTNMILAGQRESERSFVRTTASISQSSGRTGLASMNRKNIRSFSTSTRNDWIAAQVDKEHIDKFWRDGVVVLKGVMNDECLGTLAEGVEAGIASPTAEAAFNEAMLLRGASKILRPQKLPRQGGFLRDYYTYKSNSHLSKFIFDSPCAHLAAQVLRSKQVNLLYDQLFVKEVLYDSVTPWHQDQAYYAVEGKQIGSTWVPLDPVPHEASMFYLCGSHTWGTGRDWLPTRFIQGGEEYQGFTGNMKPLPDIDELLIRRSDASDPGLVGHFEHNGKLWDVRTFEVMPGDVLLFHGACLHAAPGNPSNTNRRRALAIRWVGDDCVWVEKDDATHQIPNTPTAANMPRDLKAGDPLRLDEVAFPRGWPRTS